MNRLFIRRFSVDTAQIPAGSYLAGLPAVRGGGLTFTAPVTFFVGENGTGKSTLIEALAVAYGLNPEGGSRNFAFSTRDSHSPLWRAVHLEKGAVSPRDAYFLRAESFYNVATNIDELDDAPGDSSPLIRSAYGGVSLHEQSHGESFLALVRERFSGGGLYILDEPEAALSPARQLTLLGQMRLLVGEGSQFVVATHSPILMAYPGAAIYLLSEKGIERTEYRHTEHYLLTRRFLNDPERMLGMLFADGDADQREEP